MELILAFRSEKTECTHIAVEDLAVMRSLPNMAIVEPSDEISARAVAHMAVQYQGPLYIRLHRSSAPRIHSDDYRFNFGKAETVCKYGKDAVIFSAGILLDYALKAAEILHIEGIKVKVIEVHTIKPIDKDAIISAAKETKAVAVIQDHSIYGGLGSAIAEVLSAECPTRMRCLGIQDKFGESGEPEDLYRDNSMTVDDLVRSVKELVELKAS